MKEETNEFIERFKGLSDDELIKIHNNDLGKPGWVSARGRFHDALSKEFKKRGINSSGGGKMTNLKKND